MVEQVRTGIHELGTAYDADCGGRRHRVDFVGKGAKVRVYKMKPKKGYRRTQGHRQPYTKVQIEAINA